MRKNQMRNNTEYSIVKPINYELVLFTEYVWEIEKEHVSAEIFQAWTYFNFYNCSVNILCVNDSFFFLWTAVSYSIMKFHLVRIFFWLFH